MSSGGSQCTPGEGSLVCPGSFLFLLLSQWAAIVLDRGIWSLWVSCALLLSLQAGIGPPRESQRTDIAAAASHTICLQFPLFSPSESAAGWLKPSALLWLNLDDLHNTSGCFTVSWTGTEFLVDQPWSLDQWLNITALSTPLVTYI